jgi:hypothetical protein
MLDLSYFQNNNSNVQGFFSAGTWQTWIKPRGAKMVNIICVGSGAGGGGGFQSASTPRGGGAGGGSGATARLTINANLLPDILYILTGIGGNGGLGGTTATAGSAGQNSFVTLIPDTGLVSNVVLRSGTTPAVGGAAGSTVNVTGGATETISLIANNIFANLGVFTFQAGAVGNTGSTFVGGSNTTPTNFIVQASGGGGTGSGGSSTGGGVFPSFGGAPVNTNGYNGIILYKPTLMLFGGGGGGGSSAAGTNGGNGGNGAPGAGGGGGGASSNTGVNAGNGGRGGNGFVIITTSL